MTDSYRVRPYEPADIDGIRALYRTVSSHEPSEEWFEWKFTRSPYADDVAMFVAEQGKEIVGMRPYHVVPLCAGERTIRAGYLQNVMIHPDHRGEGLFSRLNERAIDHMNDRASLLFCLTNANSRPIYAHWGWKAIGTARMYYRVQNATRLAGVFGDDPLTRLAGRAGTTLAGGYLAACDRLAPVDTDITIERESGVPAETLTSLYRRHVPDALHVRQDEAFYRWRYESPRWDAETYIALRDGDPVAAVVTRTRQAYDDITIAHVADAVPLSGEAGRVYSTLLGQAMDNHEETDILATTDTTISPTVLVRNGFVPDDAPLLSRFRAGYVWVVRALGDIDAAFENESNWALPLAVRDTS